MTQKEQPQTREGGERLVSLREVLAICDEPTPEHYSDYIDGARWVRQKVLALRAAGQLEPPAEYDTAWIEGGAFHSSNCLKCKFEAALVAAPPPSEVNAKHPL